MKSFSPYLSFQGNAEKAMTFYKNVLGGDFILFEKFGQMPGNEKLPPQVLDKVMHISLKLVNGLTIMASDVVEGMGKPFKKGNDISISIEADNKEEVDRLYKSLSKDGVSDMEPEVMFWGSYFTSFTDQFGIGWMISYSET
jgi:PhnB protein